MGERDTPYYDGYVERQAFVTFAQREQAKIAAKRVEFETIMKDSRTDDDTYSDVALGDAMEMGKQLGLRIMAQWARDNKVDDEDFQICHAECHGPHYHHAGDE